MRSSRGIIAASAAWVLALGVGSRAEDGDVDRAEVQVQVEPAADAPPREKLEPLPPAPLLLEKVMRGFLEAAPGRETLDDVMRRAAARNRAAAEEVQRRQFIRQQAQQFEQLFQPLLRVELSFVHRACGSLSPADRKEVLAASREAVRAIAERVARQQLEGQAAAGPIDIRAALHEKVSAALEPRADREEFAAYARESRLRRERRAEVARIRIVAKLDEQLGLTAPQRAAVLDDLRSHWEAAWVRELEDHDGVMINDQPPAPDFAATRIVPHLDPIQLARWREWTASAGWEAIPRGGIDWAELNALQQGQQKLDPWWPQ